MMSAGFEWSRDSLDRLLAPTKLRTSLISDEVFSSAFELKRLRSERRAPINGT